MKDKNCPYCPNRCSQNNLKCGRGRSYFGNNNSISKPKTINEQIIENLKKCGHILHHNKELDYNNFLSGLTENELDEFHRLLSKICINFE